MTMRTPDRGLYFHSDRGSQYSSQAVRKPLSVIGANLSMSGLGNCYDNAKAEAFLIFAASHPPAPLHLRTSMPTKITDLTVHDIRFPTSRALDGSDAMNPAPDYSATYVVLKTNSPQGLAGHGLTFTIGRGNEICVTAVKSLAALVVGATLEEIFADMGGFWRYVTAGDSQLRC